MAAELYEQLSCSIFCVGVAEHSPQGRRGFYTSWIQTTATVGLFLSLIVILVLRLTMSPENFAAYGWRIPFLLSIILLGFSIWIRLQLNESPAFQRSAAGTTPRSPLSLFSAARPGRRWSGTPASSTPCSS